MKHEDLVKFAKDEGAYAGDIKYGQQGEFIGFVYLENNNYPPKSELSKHFAVPIQSEE